MKVSGPDMKPMRSWPQARSRATASRTPLMLSGMTHCTRGEKWFTQITGVPEAATSSTRASLCRLTSSTPATGPSSSPVMCSPESLMPAYISAQPCL